MKERVLNSYKRIIEQRLFGVCAFIGEKLGINDSHIRIYFIYASFLALGSPILIYLFFAFWLEIKEQYTQRRRTVWDL